MTPSQARMARAAVQIGVREIAAMAGVVPSTLSRFEKEHGDMRLETARKLQSAYEKLGVRFVTEGGQACICYVPPTTEAAKE